MSDFGFKYILKTREQIVTGTFQISRRIAHIWVALKLHRSRRLFKVLYLSIQKSSLQQHLHIAMSINNQ